MITFTTCTKKQFERHGLRFLLTFTKHFPGELFWYADFDIDSPRVTVLPVPGKVRQVREHFNQYWQRSNKSPRQIDFVRMRMGIRFACVVEALQSHGKFCWLDSDIVIARDVPKAFLDGLTDGVEFTYLGTGGVPDFGYMGFNLEDPQKLAWALRKRFLISPQAMAALYGANPIEAIKQAAKTRNLTPYGEPKDHVFIQSPLGHYMDHLVGTKRKNLGYSPER